MVLKHPLAVWVDLYVTEAGHAGGFETSREAADPFERANELHVMYLLSPDAVRASARARPNALRRLLAVLVRWSQSSRL